MKLMTSGVTFSAAMVRSPSFSRSSSSTTTTIRPCRMSSMASGMRARTASDLCRSAAAGATRGSGAGAQQPLDVLGDHVDLQVDGSPGRAARRFVCSSVYGMSATVKPPGRRRGHGERDAVHRDRALLHQVALEAGGSGDAQLGGRARALPGATISPTPSTWPCTMWPSKRPSARIGRSRFTSAPGTQPLRERGAGQRLRASARR